MQPASQIRASRLVSDRGHDDTVLPFAVAPLDLRGRLVRLGPAIDRILSRHDYPSAVARLAGEAAALTVLLGSSLKIDGRFQMQTRTDGIVDMIVVDFDGPDRLRAFARFDSARLNEAIAQGRTEPGDLLGHGHLAFTIERGGDLARYQGVVALEGDSFEEAAHRYFRQSEQIPTFVRLAVGENVTGSGSNWRAGGLLVQFLPAAPERRRQPDFDPGDAPEGVTKSAAVAIEDDAWTEGKALAATVEDHELVDPMLSGERLLYRLFHERGVRVFESQSIQDVCRCSTERVASMLRQFTPQERADMVGDNGKIGVTCEFCSTHREFDPAEFDNPRPEKVTQ
jgi:molecular chaperone Hsp33